MTNVFNLSLPVTSKSKLLSKALVYWDMFCLKDYTCYLNALSENCTEMVYFNRKDCVTDELNFMQAQRREHKQIRAYSIKNRWHSFRTEKESLIHDAEHLQSTLKYNLLNYQIIDLMSKADHPFKLRNTLQKNRRYRLLFKAEPLEMPEFEQYKYVAFKHTSSLKNLLQSYDRLPNKKQPISLETYLTQILSTYPQTLELMNDDENAKKCG